MSENTAGDKERIARELGWSSYADAPAVVRNNIDSTVEGPIVEDPFGFLRGDE